MIVCRIDTSHRSDYGRFRGLGLALARALAARGWNLIINGRNADRLRAVRDELAAVTHVAALAGDVTDAPHRDALAVLARGHAGLDAVINNAGALGPSPLPELVHYPSAHSPSCTWRTSWPRWA